MADLISRKAAIDLWDKYHPYIATKAIAYDRELRALPSAQPQWIDINEELPDVDEDVLVHLNDNYYNPICIMSMHIRGNTGDNDSWTLYWKTQEESIEFDMKDVVAWMPLPKPYKGGD